MIGSRPEKTAKEKFFHNGAAPKRYLPFTWTVLGVVSACIADFRHRMGRYCCGKNSIMCDRSPCAPVHLGARVGKM